MNNLSFSLGLTASFMMIVTTMTGQQIVVRNACNNIDTIVHSNLTETHHNDNLAFRHQPERFMMKHNEQTCYIHPNLEMLHVQKKSLTQNEEIVRVSWEADYNPSLYSPVFLNFINIELGMDFPNRQFGYENEWGKNAYMDIPTGTYDIFAEFFGPEYTMYYVIRENVEINENVHFTFSPLEATQTITKHHLDENGEELKLKSIERIDEEPWFKIVEEGNCINMCPLDIVILKGVGVLAHNQYINYDCSVEVPDGPYSIHVSPCSDRVIVGSVGTILGSNDKLYQFNLFTDQTSTCTNLTNNPEDYITLISESFCQSPIGKANNTENRKGYHSQIYLDNNPLSSLETFDMLSCDDNQTTLKFLTNKPSNEYGVKISTRSVMLDMQGTTLHKFEWEDEEGNIITDGWEEEWSSMVYGLSQNPDENGINFINNGIGVHIPSNFQFLENNDIPILTGHPVFSYQKEQIGCINGNSCPICVVEMQNTYNPWSQMRDSYLAPSYIGRRGEIRETDNLWLKANLYHNSEVVSSEWSSLNEDLFMHCMEHGVEGKWEATFVNTNILVDNLEGKNTVKTSYDGSQEDYTSPTLQMLDFRNLENMVIDRFETPEQGILQFACGDFNFHWPIEGNRYFDCKPVSVKTEYSVYQEEDWTELTSITEKEEYFCRPAFGYFYSGSLAEVDAPSETGWYDLRITLTDETGNTQEQTISPAFKIGNGTPTTIRTIEQTDVNNIYTLQGQKAQKQLNELGAGMYVVGGKKVVKM